MNRRFVSFFFNVGKGQNGYDKDAAKLIAGIDKRFAGRRVPTPPVWILSPEGKLLTTINNFATKDKFYTSLIELLKKHPEFNKNSEDEAAVLKNAKDKADSFEAQLAAGRLQDELGQYEAAEALFQKATKAGKESNVRASAFLGLARMARYQKSWDKAKPSLKEILDADPKNVHKFADDCGLEQGLSLIAGKNFKEARTLLEATIKAHPKADQMGSLRFYAGVAAFMLEDKQWANYHWGWVMKNIPDDNQYMRCYMASTAGAMPYPNPELGGYRGKGRMISHRIADAARNKAMKDYEKLKAKF